jgi:hypothetical protein
MTVRSGAVADDEQGVEFYSVDEPERDPGVVRSDPLADALVIRANSVGIASLLVAAPGATATGGAVILTGATRSMFVPAA